MSKSVVSDNKSTATSLDLSSTKDAYHEVAKVLTEGVSKDEVKVLYTDWANKYDEHMRCCDFNGPFMVSKTVNDNCLDKNISILDVACGTGTVGEHLQQFGFTNVDGMDISIGMLDKAKSKKVYNKYICSGIGAVGSTDILDNTYDVITISGGFGPGHIPCEAVDEMIRIVKSGGFIFNIGRVNCLEFSEYKNKWEPYLAKKEEEKKWREISRTIYRNYVQGNDGILYIHKVL